METFWKLLTRCWYSTFFFSFPFRIHYLEVRKTLARGADFSKLIFFFVDPQKKQWDRMHFAKPWGRVPALVNWYFILVFLWNSWGKKAKEESKPEGGYPSKHIQQKFRTDSCFEVLRFPIRILVSKRLLSVSLI